MNNILRGTFATIAVLLVVGSVFGVIGDLTKANNTYNVNGWGWSDNIGWVSFSCEDSSSCGSVDYGVSVGENGFLSGYAWSSHIGWITFNEEELSGCPQPACNARVVDGELQGWAKALAGDDSMTELEQQVFDNPARSPQTVTAPNGADRVTFEVWGAGGGGGGDGPNATKGEDGGDTSVDDFIFARGGSGALTSGGAAGDASGGDINKSGENGKSRSGCSAPGRGGDGAESPNSHGLAASGSKKSGGDARDVGGGGGGGYFTSSSCASGGGGGGGYAKISQTTISGKSYTVTVGAGGSGGRGGSQGGDGEDGKVIVTFSGNSSSDEAGGWDGYISLSGEDPTYGPEHKTTDDGIHTFEGFAWGGDVVGWIKFGLSPYEPKECDDGIDNDGDGWTDYPNDPNCTDRFDDSEAGDAGDTECSDLKDNDDDELIDGNDPGCTDHTDDDETDPKNFSLEKSNNITATLIGDEPEAQSNEAAITASVSDTFEGDISLSVSNVTPAIPGATYHFEPSAAITEGAYGTGSAFSITVPSGTPSRTYEIVVRGEGQGEEDTLTRTITILLTVDSKDPQFENF